MKKIILLIVVMVSAIYAINITVSTTYKELSFKRQLIEEYEQTNKEFASYVEDVWISTDCFTNLYGADYTWSDDEIQYVLDEFYKYCKEEQLLERYGFDYRVNR